jgi:PhnB protein
MARLPAHTSFVIPRLICRDPATELDFCRTVLGAVVLNERLGPKGELVHALVTIHSEMIMIDAEWPTLPSRAPQPDGTSPVVIFLYVEDVDSTVRSAVDSGATVLVPASDQFWGDRIAWIMDPNAHVWTLATRIEETTAEERAKRWSELR